MKLQIKNPNNVFTIDEKRNYQARPIQYELLECGCHVCVSHDLDKDGYPRIHRGKDRRMSHIILELNTGEKVPTGKVVMHICDNPNCINPDHLKLGTHKENMMDRAMKGRNPRGENHWRSSLKKEDVYFIKFIATEPHQELSKKFKVSVDTIKNIRLGKSWKWLTIDDYQKAAA